MLRGRGAKSNIGGGFNFTVVPHIDERPFQVRLQEGNRVETILMPNDVWKGTERWEPADSVDFALDPDGEWYNETVRGDVMGGSLETNEMSTGDNGGEKREAGETKETQKAGDAASQTKKARSKLSKRPHVVWKDLYRSIYLDEICRAEGRGDFRAINLCRDCKQKGRTDEKCGDAIYRCSSECFLSELVCQDCCVRRHKTLPFHRIEKWNGSYFTAVTLKSLGLRIQLNHISMSCSNPIACHTSMAVIHTNGVHDVAFDYCGCEKAEPHHIQLLRRRIYPASQHIIRNCATFEVLKHLHKFALTTKASTYDFHRALDRLTDSTGLNPPKFKYRILFRMIMQWRHLMMLKWAGRALDPGGAKETKAGELAILCPSCPFPNINLPGNWRDAPKDKSFLYRLFACMDANFRLKNQLVSNWDQDPGLGLGLAYMIPRKEYENYCKKMATEQDLSTCVGFQAIIKANTRFSRGLRYTGVGGVMCGRSEMYLPQGIGNLQKGERYANMDFIFGSAMEKYQSLNTIVIGYDIACQWFTNLKKRIETLWPRSLVLKTGTASFIPAIPKLHEPAHQGENHEQYSLNYLPGVGQSDLECLERGWGAHNAVGNSTKTQGPGSRCDVLDDHLNFWNYEKYIRMGLSLLRKYRIALADRNLQTEAHKGLTSSVTKRVADQWEIWCVKWESEPYPKTTESPYVVQVDGYTEADAKNELAKEEEKRLAAGGKIVNDTSSVSFLIMALDIEDEQ
ncbi:hypothetical protein CVT24_004822 [Panaeolus cyanescens]|uniref:CxC2-like cysteine cluster KDZ transposase-associated domain-containing protein n=1 Tax=Panaeolus cyanescens TaxID=181874 RepID=A0A409WVT1_9AGAR|nr:hypothetical protein CVT24_004822 [Panaeolus cyanescens]